jgi:hypothetical protein
VVYRSIRTVKADAARRSFPELGQGIVWAVLGLGSTLAIRTSLATTTWAATSRAYTATSSTVPAKVRANR